MDTPTPATPSYPPTPSSPDLLPEMNDLSINPSSTSGPPGTAENDELEKFRNQWREEVKAKKGDKPEESKVKSKDREREVEVGPVRWKGKGKDNSQPDLPSEPTLEKENPTHTMNQKSPEKTRIKLPSPTSPKKPLKFIPGETVDLDKLDSHLLSTTFTPFKAPSSINRPARFNGSIAPEGTESAIQIYQRAIESEQSGKLNEALILYRRAFKLDDDVDRTYARSLKSKSLSSSVQHPSSDADIPPTPSSTDIISPAPPTIEPYSFARHIQTAPDYEKSHPPPSLPTPTTQTTSLSPLTKLFNDLPVPPSELSFQPEEEELPCPITKLPSELFEPILMNLDVTSIERFGSACWKSRWLTHVSLTWRNIAERIYRPPAMLPPPPRPEETVENGDFREDDDEGDAQRGEKMVPQIGVRDLVKRHRNEWRTTVVEEERVRMDGCYIAVCHYIRPGAGDEWVTITHMITYHRFLRFYPDGNVISFLTTDHPSEIVPSLRPSIRGKGLHFGRWRLIRSDSDEPTTTTQTTTKDGKRFARVVVSDLLEPGNENPKYEFEMELILKSTGRGRWNKLEILEYRSINLRTGEVLALALKHQKPFYFSKVRSYNPPL